MGRGKFAPGIPSEIGVQQFGRIQPPDNERRGIDQEFRPNDQRGAEGTKRMAQGLTEEARTSEA